MYLDFTFLSISDPCALDNIYFKIFDLVIRSRLTHQRVRLLPPRQLALGLCFLFAHIFLHHLPLLLLSARSCYHSALHS